MKKYFITGIGTNIGKTLVATIFTEALHADYWKPIQAGSLEHTDTDTVKALISNTTSQFHPSSYALKTPMSPHAAAAIDGITITLENLQEPSTTNHLIIEGAGGLMVPLNATDTICDSIQPDYQVIIVSKHYLGSINHTLMTVEMLKQRNLNIFGIVFNGPETKSTETIIQQMTGIAILGRIDNEPLIDKATVQKYAQEYAPKLH